MYIVMTHRGIIYNNIKQFLFVIFLLYLTVVKAYPSEENKQTKTSDRNTSLFGSHFDPIRQQTQTLLVWGVLLPAVNDSEGTWVRGEVVHYYDVCFYNVVCGKSSERQQPCQNMDILQGRTTLYPDEEDRDRRRLSLPGDQSQDKYHW